MEAVSLFDAMCVDDSIVDLLEESNLIYPEEKLTFLCYMRGDA